MFEREVIVGSLCVEGLTKELPLLPLNSLGDFESFKFALLEAREFSKIL